MGFLRANEGQNNEILLGTMPWALYGPNQARKTRERDVISFYSHLNEFRAIRTPFLWTSKVIKPAANSRSGRRTLIRPLRTEKSRKTDYARYSTPFRALRQLKVRDCSRDDWENVPLVRTLSLNKILRGLGLEITNSEPCLGMRQIS